MLLTAALTQESIPLETPVTDVDQDDLRQCQNGDEAAYARIVKRYESVIGRQMWRFTRDPLKLEELVQEVFVESYMSLHSFKGTAPFEHWLRRIASRVGYRHWKRKARDNERLEKHEQLHYEFTLNRDTATPSEAGEFLYNLLETLPTQERMVLTLLYFEGWDTQEIADHMGWTRSLVKVRAFRARKKLKTKLEAAGYESA